MFTARITRKVGEEVTKEEISNKYVSVLLTNLFMLPYEEDEILEIHIVREK